VVSQVGSPPAALEGMDRHHLVPLDARRGLVITTAPRELGVQLKPCPWNGFNAWQLRDFGVELREVTLSLAKYCEGSEQSVRRGCRFAILFGGSGAVRS
jgi:hypothetical protein